MDSKLDTNRFVAGVQHDRYCPAVKLPDRFGLCRSAELEQFSLACIRQCDRESRPRRLQREQVAELCDPALDVPGSSGRVHVGAIGCARSTVSRQRPFTTARRSPTEKIASPAQR